MLRITGKASKQRESWLDGTRSKVPYFNSLIIRSADNACAISVHAVDSTFVTSDGPNAPPTRKGI